jgi:hypothetical protein
MCKNAFDKRKVLYTPPDWSPINANYARRQRPYKHNGASSSRRPQQQSSASDGRKAYRRMKETATKFSSLDPEPEPHDHRA